MKVIKDVPHFVSTRVRQLKPSKGLALKQIVTLLILALSLILASCSQEGSPAVTDTLNSASVSKLPKPGSLKSKVEGLARYDGEPAHRCGGGVKDLKPGPRAFRAYLAQLDITANTYHACQRGFHPVGQALDIYASPSQMQAFANWLTANNNEMAKRLGIVQIIWERRIWLSYGSRPGDWQSHGGSDPHTNHVHLSFGTAGARGSTSFFKEVIGNTCTWPTVKEGNRGRRVKQLQYFLKSHMNPQLEVDGKFGPNTKVAVIKFQKKNELAVDGVVGPDTWLKLTQKSKVRLGSKGNAVRAVQVGVGTTVDGKFGTTTEKAVKTLQKRNKLEVDGVVGPNTWPAVVFGPGCK